MGCSLSSRVSSISGAGSFAATSARDVLPIDACKEFADVSLHCRVTTAGASDTRHEIRQQVFISDGLLVSLASGLVGTLRAPRTIVADAALVFCTVELPGLSLPAWLAQRSAGANHVTRTLMSGGDTL